MHGERVFIGFDQDEWRACQVARDSLRATTTTPMQMDYVDWACLISSGVYTRSTQYRRTEIGGLQRYDGPSDAPMSTTHAIARFFVPFLCEHRGWALFMDGDVLVRADIARLFAMADERYAVQVVQHPPMPTADTKKDGAPQTSYARKNWSSVMLLNCGHPAHAALTLEVLNSWPGRDLHAFRWLPDELVGSLPPEWNYLVGVTAPRPADVALAHFTLGTPNLPGHEHDEFAQEWWAYEQAMRSEGRRA